MLYLAITTSVNSLFAQKTEILPEENIKRFSIGLSFGTGHTRANTFNNQAIADFGYSSLSPTGMGHLDLDYMLTDNISVHSGIAGQSLDLRYEFEDSEYRYNGTRGIVPLGLRIHIGSNTSRGKFLIGAGGYYAFDTDDLLVSDNDFEESNIFNGFGIWSTMGFSYAITDDMGFNASINAMTDLSANILQTRSSFVSIGAYMKF